MLNEVFKKVVATRSTPPAVSGPSPQSSPSTRSSIPFSASSLPLTPPYHAMIPDSPFPKPSAPKASLSDTASALGGKAWGGFKSGFSGSFGDMTEHLVGSIKAVKPGGPLAKAANLAGVAAYEHLKDGP